MSDPSVIPKEKLTAFERWELADFAPDAKPRAATKPPSAGGATATAKASAKAGAEAPGQAGAEPPIRLPTADELEQIRQEAQRAGYAAGYEEGTARARMEALRLHTLVENFNHAFAEIDAQVSRELLALALEIAGQVVRQTLKVKPEVVLAVVREALAQLPHQHASIYLHPEDASLVRSYIGDQLTHGGHRILEEAGVARGGCRVEAAGSQVDASVELRWRRVLESLGMGSDWLERDEADSGESA